MWAGSECKAGMDKRHHYCFEITALEKSGFFPFLGLILLHLYVSNSPIP